MVQSPNSVKHYLNSLDINTVINGKNQNAQFRFILTQLCNAHCFFCHNEGLAVKERYMQKEFFQKMIDAIKEMDFSQKIRFTWWEPLLHKDIFDFVAYIRKKIPSANIGITTNGLLISKRLVGILDADIDSITVSLHTLSAEKYKKITGVDGLSSVIKGLWELSKNFKWRIKINTVVNQINKDEVKSLWDFAKDKNFTLRLMDVLTHNNHNRQLSSSRHIPMQKLQSTMHRDLVQSLKWDRTQEKCLNCTHKDVCGHEASYLRISPNEVLNPCLSMKNFDIPLDWLVGDDLKRAIALWLYRTKKLDI